MGANDKWQCTEIESMKNDPSECVHWKHLELTRDEKKKFEEYKERRAKGQDTALTEEEQLAPPVIPYQVRELVMDI